MELWKRTFSLNDLDKKFWDSVILAQVQHSSGLGGPGCIWLITTEKKTYFISFEAFPYNERKLEEFSPLFRKMKTIVDYDHPYIVDGKGWKFLPKENVLVRDDFYDALMKEYDQEWNSNDYICIPKLAGRALGLDDMPERYDEEVVAAIWRERNEREKQREQEKERWKLTTDDFKWKPIYFDESSKYGEIGNYVLLYAREEGDIIRYQFTILYQWEEKEPGLLNPELRIEAYNLFEARKRQDRYRKGRFYEHHYSKERDYRSRL